MIFTNHELCDQLIPYIESIFHYKDFMPDHSVERVIPTGHMFLIFELDGFVRNTYDNEKLTINATFSNVWLSGQQDSYITISAHDQSEMLIVQFKPFGGLPFIQSPLGNFSNLVRPGEEVFDTEILALRSKLLQLSSATEKLTLVSTWLRSRIDTSLTAPMSLVDVVKKIHETTDQNFASATIDYPLSNKHLIDQFKKYVGITPKRYHRIIRFNTILEQMNNKVSMSWSDIAYQCGYSDQSHFIKEFKRFSGFNPSEFISNNHQGETNFFPLDRQG